MKAKMHWWIILAVGCQSTPTNQPDSYQFVEREGIFFENFDSTQYSDHTYSEDNLIFKIGRQFAYNYEFFTADNQNMRVCENRNPNKWQPYWTLIPVDSTNTKTISQIELIVEKRVEVYEQTPLRYEYLNSEGKVLHSNLTGIVENKKNVWIYPPRGNYFRILELNPFPFIQTPYEMGNEWNYSLSIGSGWGDKRWKTWKGSINNQCTYRITDRKKIDSGLGSLECLVVEAEASSSIGSTNLTAYFNPKYGFVKLDYKNIDQSRVCFTLREVSVAASKPSTIPSPFLTEEK
ncbi:MAG: hypothetical protein AAF992_08065 [Bacteroidota bacterium]